MANEIKHTAELIEPQERLRHLIDYCNAVEVDFHIPPTRYYRSGLEMVRMANVYYNEGNLENAYVLYLKFMTIFLEKIRKHPDFNSVPDRVKAMNQAKMREILPKAEKLKERLLNRYKEEHRRYVAGRERKKRKERENSVDTVKTEPNIASVSSKQDIPGRNSATVNVSPDLNVLKPTILEDCWDTCSVDRSNKPQGYDSTGLRKVVVPGGLTRKFQHMAQKNTMNNVETCGVLAGQLAKDRLIITHMILPKQKGTADTCTTMCEEELFDFQDQHNLITIGWIHTHPTQTAFLSSVDLHTHCPYQLLMPEAIAIVCAPRYDETGFFVLTRDYGLKFIANCRKTGFHPHPTDPPLFMVADHVRLDQNAHLEVMDLRKGKC